MLLAHGVSLIFIAGCALFCHVWFVFEHMWHGIIVDFNQMKVYYYLSGCSQYVVNISILPRNKIAAKL